MNSIASSQTQPVAPAAAPAVVWSGMDVGKLKFDAALCFDLAVDRDDRRSMPTCSFARTAGGVEQFEVWLDQQLAQRGRDGSPARACMESTGSYSMELIGWLRQARAPLQPALLNPAYVKHFGQSLGVRGKTDKADARTLALFGAERFPPAWQPPAPGVQRVAELVGERKRLVDQLSAARLHAQSTPVKQNPIQRARARVEKLLGEEIARLDKLIGRAFRDDPALSAVLKLWDPVPGVGITTAATVLARAGDVRRFHSGRALAAFTGWSPDRFESGTTVWRPTRLCKRGDPLLRAALFTSAMAACLNTKKDNRIKRFYERLVSHGKTKMQALCAAARKILLLMRALWISGQPYDDAHCPSHRPAAAASTQTAATPAAAPAPKIEPAATVVAPGLAEATVAKTIALVAAATHAQNLCITCAKTDENST